LGGGTLLEGLKQQLRAQYDYVLIDSRTGLSDTSGICTVQMPDQLVVCFTLNRQSVQGAAAVAASANTQRRRPSGEPSLRIWPLVTRVEHGEKERMDAARAAARAAFQYYLGHLPRARRAEYWSDTEVLHQPYFAFEEVLAVFAEQQRHRSSMLASMEAVTRYVSDEAVKELRNMTPGAREQGLQAFRQVNAQALVAASPGVSAAAKRGQIFVAYPREDKEMAVHVVRVLERVLRDRGSSVKIWFDLDAILPGEDWQKALDEAVASSQVTIAIFGPGWIDRKNIGHFEAQVEYGLRPGKRIIPLLVGGLSFDTWTQLCVERGVKDVVRRYALAFGSGDELVVGAKRLAAAIEQLLRDFEEHGPKSADDPEDPNKGQWGGRSGNGSRRLSAEVEAVSENWFQVSLRLEQVGGELLEGDVEFHLHPTFSPANYRVQARSGFAELEVQAWGAFTVGVRADGGETLLELDLSEVEGAPQRFRER